MSIEATMANAGSGGVGALRRHGEASGPDRDVVHHRIVATCPEGLGTEGGIRLYRHESDRNGRLRLDLHGRHPVALSDVVPVFENFGFRVIAEWSIDSGRTAENQVQRFILELPAETDAEALIAREAVISGVMTEVIVGRAENDGFNSLIVTADLKPDAVLLFRALFHYLRQTGMTYGEATTVEALKREPKVAGRLVSLFEALHDPDLQGERTRIADAQFAIEAGLEAVTAIDHDRVLRRLRAVIAATLRTNFYSPSAAEAVAFKIDGSEVPGLPAPIPWREIWVYSPRVEAIHLRSGPVARGGLRWSDRRDDFRTEVLGLMKAQRIKNAVIVPTGAKGGFFPKRLPDPRVDRSAWLAEGRAAYGIFIRALLSVTDNIGDGRVIHPQRVMVRDDDDPYLVVAADKGTATFSDAANAIAEAQGFWLGDAFASGGSNGYDHKAMGITARGAWLGVQRHFAELGRNVQVDPVTVIGCGDMSGDVFGNGMLLSRSLRLVAAFDHRHIFFDPSPDAARSWEERQRLFALPQSSWDDYRRDAISRGGGVWSRTLKRIPLSCEVQELLDVDARELDPAALIAAILRAKVDMLWFGGIGTYVKARAESHAEVGDPGNDHLRIDAEAVRATVVAEGANLGVTQAGRIAFASAGGRINADFIDNSAGVDCSDHEVNIKIALRAECLSGRLTKASRDVLLREMTDDVAGHVLEDNRLQALGLSVAEAGGAAVLPRHVRLIELFEETGRLDRKVEGLAAGDQLLRRVQEGCGLTRPELATVIATSKLALQEAIEGSEYVADAELDAELLAAFPAAMRTRHARALADHQLRREIVATKVANRLVNRLGPLAAFEISEEEGCSPAEVARAFLLTEQLFDTASLWNAIDEADISEPARIALLSTMATGLRAQIGDVLRTLPAEMPPIRGAARLADGLSRLTAPVDRLLPAEASERSSAVITRLEAAGAPSCLSRRVAMLFKLDGAVGLADVALRLGADEIVVAESFIRLGRALGVDWVQSAAARQEPADPWERLLAAGIARDMQHIRLDLLSRASDSRLEPFVGRWEEANRQRIEQYRKRVERGRSVPTTTVSILAELAGQARALLSGSGNGRELT